MPIGTRESLEWLAVLAVLAMLALPMTVAKGVSSELGGAVCSEATDRRLEITDSRNAYDLVAQIKVGKTKKEICSLLGEPSRSNDSVWNYSFGGCPAGWLAGARITFDGDVVAEIEPIGLTIRCG